MGNLERGVESPKVQAGSQAYGQAVPREIDGHALINFQKC